MPCCTAHATIFLYWYIRSFFLATHRLPHFLKPVYQPRSSRCEYRSRLITAILVSRLLGFSTPISPVACQVVPPPSSPYMWL